MSGSVDKGEMGISMGGSSETLPATDDTRLLNTVKIVTAHDGVVYADTILPGKHNLLLGREINASTSASDSIVIGENVSVAAGVRNAVSIGRRNHRITASDTFDVGDFLSYDSARKHLSLADGRFTIDEPSGEIAMGRTGAFRIAEEGVAFHKPLCIKSQNNSTGDWQIAVQPSDEDANVSDLVIKSSDGTAVVFCAGGPRPIS